MTLHIHRRPRAAAAALAGRVAAEIARRPDLVLGLPTGRTPVPFYERLVAAITRRRVDVSRVRTFNLDEFCGLSRDHPGSYHAYMTRHLFGRVPIPPEHVHFLNGTAPDTAAECARYEQAIADAGGIDLQVLGIGANGHIGFNEPARGLHARTHCAVLTRGTRRANAVFFRGRSEEVPVHALSMGMATILGAREIVLLAFGSGKARAIHAAVNGPITTRVPASFLQVHPRVDVLLDEAAARDLREGRREPADSLTDGLPPGESEG